MLKSLFCSNRKSQNQVDNTSSCAYCSAKQSLKLYPTYSISGDNFHLNRCLECNAVFLSPPPTTEQLQKAYDDSYYGQGDEKFTGWIERILDYFRSARVRTVNKYIKPPARILDIGCGNGRLLDGLIKRGFEGYGIELPGKAAQRAAQIGRLQLKTGTLEQGDYNPDFFDGICMWHVFEHLTKPKETLQIIQKILKPGGFLFISLPNIDSIQSRLFKGKWLHLDPPKHLFFLGKSDLISQMKDLGFKLIGQTHFSLEQNPFGIQQSLLNCFFKKREILFEALKGNITYTQQHSPLSIILQKLFYITTFPVFALLAAPEAIVKKGGTMELIFQKGLPKK